MNKREAWQRIPSLVHRYGPCAARAVCDVVDSMDDSVVLKLIIQADACALYGNPQQAAQLYVRASQAVKHDTCLRQISALLESAVYCDPSHVETRMQLIQALHTGCSFWRAGEHMQLLTDFDCSKIALSRWIEFLAQLSIEPRMQAGLFQCCAWLTQCFTRSTEQQQIFTIITVLQQSAHHAWAACWYTYVKKQLDSGCHDRTLWLQLVQN